MSKVIKFWSKVFDKIENDITLELEEVIFSKKHGHEICIMHLVGKNIFPKMTPQEILSNPKARAGLNRDDLITITRLDMEIKQRKNHWKVLELNRNGTVLLGNHLGEEKLYLDQEISADIDLQNKILGSHTHAIGYRVGLKEGLSISKQKQTFIKKITSLFKLTK